MKKLSICLIFLASFASNQTNAQYISYDDCLEIIQQINPRMPVQINETTIGYKAACFRERNDGKLAYFYTVTGDGRSRLGADQTQIVINTWCTQVQLRKLLKELVAVEFRYFDEAGNRLKTFKFSESACL